MRGFHPNGRPLRRVAAMAALLGGLAVTEAAGVTLDQVRRVPLLQAGPRLAEPVRVAADSSLLCFDGFLTTLINPGCFAVPGFPGDCVSGSQHYFVQFFFFDLPGTWQIKEIAFISNDAATVFPSAGVVIVPDTPTEPARFPTTQELSALQVQDISSAQDTSLVVVDLLPFDLLVDADQAIAVCLQFPNGGQLISTGVGPGIAADDGVDGSPCTSDFFTLTAGDPSGWFEPAQTDLDWGFELVVQPPVGVASRPWSVVKQLYRNP